MAKFGVKKKSGSGGKRRLRPSARAVVSYVLIAAGSALILFAGIYALVDYPWRILFQGPETFKTDTLPDPEPPVLDGVAVTYNPDAVADSSPPPLVRTLDEPEEDEDLPGSDLPEEPEPSRGPAIVCQVIGAVKIPKIGISVNLMDDVTQTHLRLGAGFVRGTALPGRPGNCSIAGHRVTARMHPFRHLDKMAAGDYVFVKYGEHTYVYETTETFVVSNKERWIMDPVPAEKYLLTLITCHPVGSARQRLILRARLVEIDGMTPEEFYAPPEPTAPPEPPEVLEPTVSEPIEMPETPGASETPASPEPPEISGTSETPEIPEIPEVIIEGSGDIGGPEAPEAPPGSAAPPPDGDAPPSGASASPTSALSKLPKPRTIAKVGGL
ncbi:MAG: class D sortase [Oscillospiraceae bacterium]|jgi:LPXTG-site transpeptidase (sortase) family protein|nr:class D sortase [Oscillospiraceae bacterium]